MKKTFTQILTDMERIYAEKNTAYGNSFIDSLDEDGLIVAKIRMNEKLNRFKQLYKNFPDNHTHDESLLDTLVDLANYAVITASWLSDKIDTDVLVKPKFDILDGMRIDDLRK